MRLSINGNLKKDLENIYILSKILDLRRDGDCLKLSRTHQYIDNKTLMR